MFFLLEKGDGKGFFIREVRPGEAEAFRNSFAGTIVDEDPSDIEALRERAEILLFLTPFGGPVEIHVLED